MDAEDSDIEMEGMDMEIEDDGETAEADGEDDDSPAADEETPEEDDKEIDALAMAEAKEMEEARREQMELMAAEQKRATAGKPPPATPQERLKYILAQSDVFAHFLAGKISHLCYLICLTTILIYFFVENSGSVAAGGKKGRTSRGKKGRMSEAQEDAQMLKSAQSKRRVVRVDRQPSNLASHCKMHPYQLEGLNW